MESEEEIISSTSLLDLPVVVLIYLGKYLELKDIFNFRCCSRYSKEVGNAMLSDLRVLTIGKPLDKMAFHVIVEECHRLRRICFLDDNRLSNVYDKYFNDKIEKLFCNNALLEEIEFQLVDLSNFTSETLVLLAKSCKKLVKLTIWGSNPYDKLLEALNAHNRNFLEVNFNYLAFGDKGLVKIWKFLKNQHKLQRISLPWILFFVDGYEEVLSTIFEVCHEITYLEIPWNIPTTEFYNALRKIADNCPKLKTICIGEDTKLSDELLSYLNSKNIKVDDSYSPSEHWGLLDDLDASLFHEESE